jgi:hypothetical protein
MGEAEAAAPLEAEALPLTPPSLSEVPLEIIASVEDALAVELALRTVTKGLAPSGTAPGSVVQAMNKEIMARQVVGKYTSR